MKQACSAPVASRSAKAFTLVEVLVVIVVIMILVGISVPVSKYAIRKAKEAKEKIAREQIINGLESYRAKYGEYPIPGDPRHYSVSYDVDPDGYLPESYSNIDMTVLSNTNITTNVTVDVGTGLNVTNVATNYLVGVEVLRLSTIYYIDYKLTYPLMIRQLENNETPLVNFSQRTISYFIYADGTVRKADKLKRKFNGDTGQITVYTSQYDYVSGMPINRYLAINPLTGMQYYYQSDGTTYTLGDDPW